MKCTICGGADLVFGSKKVPFSFRGRKTKIEAEGLHCPRCHEVVMNREQASEYQAKIREFKASVISETVEPEFIMQVRKKLLLTQRQAGILFGGGINAFYRYERGLAQPHPATVALLKILNEHPELLREINNRQFMPRTNGTDNGSNNNNAHLSLRVV